MQFTPLNIIEFYWLVWFIFALVVSSVFGAVILEPYLIKKFGNFPGNSWERW